jgi:poly(3-hydroxybutyrate) depolymerase
MRIIRIGAALGLAVASLFLLQRGNAADPLPALPALNIDIRETSVSGISSGGFMAVQFQVAHSAIVKGAGVVAAGPYYCSQGSAITATTACSCTFDPSHTVCSVSADSAKVPALVEATRRFAANKWIDDPAGLARQRVLSFAGGKDQTVPAPVVGQLGAYYAALGMPKDRLSAVGLADAGHTMPTTDYGAACALTQEPYLNRCNYDGAKEILSWIYGPLAKPRAKQAPGRLIKFDQRAYIPASSRYSWSNGLDSSAWLYLPASCEKGEPCRLHIALHGCRQGQTYLPLRPLPGGGTYYGTTFVEHAGYNRWAEANKIAVLYPQAVSVPFKNPNGCWDWWGYSGEHFADKQGVQIATLRAMVDRLSSGRVSQ